MSTVVAASRPANRGREAATTRLGRTPGASVGSHPVLSGWVSSQC